MESTMRVIDIPPDATVGRAEDLLNLPFEEDYYLIAIVGWKSGARAFYRRRVHGAGVGGLGGNRANRDSKDEAAKAIIRANPNMTIPALIVKLAVAGIERKKSWVSVARIETRGSGTTHSQG